MNQPILTNSAQRVWLAITTTSALAALAASTWWIFVPTYTGYSTSIDAMDLGVTELQATTLTLLDVEGPGVLITLMIPVVLAASPLLARNRPSLALWNLLAALALTAFSILGAWIIGLAYLPAAALSLAATLVALFGRMGKESRTHTGV